MTIEKLKETVYTLIEIKIFASASNNIKVTDSLNKTIIKGHYAKLFKAKDSMFIIKKSLSHNSSKK